MIKVNLVPRELIVKAQQKQYTTQAIGIGLVLATIVALVSAGHWFKAERLESSLKAKKQKLQSLQEVVDKVKALEAQASAVRTRLQVVTDLLKGRPLYPYFMMDVAKTLPPGVWLTQLGTTAKDATGLSVTASASAFSEEAIADWLRKLQSSGRFSDPTLSAISISGTEGSKVHSFNITTSYHSPDI